MTRMVATSTVIWTYLRLGANHHMEATVQQRMDGIFEARGVGDCKKNRPFSLVESA